jgi:hypothetical protein
MKQIWNKLQNINKKIISIVFLNIAYYFGVGITSLIAKISGKHFLNNNPEDSTWEKRNQEHNLEKMY